MSTNFMFEVEGDVKPGSYETESGKALQYLWMVGRGHDGLRGKIIAYGREALAFADVLGRATPRTGLPERHVVMATGGWHAPKLLRGDAKVRDNRFEATRLELLTGAQAELVLYKIDAAESLRRSDAFRRIAEAVGDEPAKAMEYMMQAYQELEANVARFTRQAPPSRTPAADLDHPLEFVEQVTPEEVALAKFQAMDATRGVPPMETPVVDEPERPVAAAPQPEPVAAAGEPAATVGAEGTQVVEATGEPEAEAGSARTQSDEAVESATEVVEPESAVAETVAAATASEEKPEFDMWDAPAEKDPESESLAAEAPAEEAPEAVEPEAAAPAVEEKVVEAPVVEEKVVEAPVVVAAPAPSARQIARRPMGRFGRPGVVAQPKPESEPKSEPVEEAEQKTPSM
jgi:hypothetical protein